MIFAELFPALQYRYCMALSSLVIAFSSTLFSISEHKVLAADDPSTAGDLHAVGRELAAIVRNRFYNGEQAEAWFAAHSGYADMTGNDRRRFVEATRAALVDLKTSHTAYFTPDDQSYHGLLSIFRPVLKIDKVEIDSIGVDIAPGGFVRTLFAGGPALTAGLRRGDRILKADGHGFQPVASFRGRAGASVRLTVQRSANESPFELVVVPRRIDVADEWLEAQKLGTKRIERHGKIIGYVPMFTAAGDLYRDLVREAIGEEFAKADALILDFRNGWGGASPTFLDLFDRNAPALDMVDRKGEHFRHDPHWRKPLYILINGGSKSGKEVVAYAVKKHKVGILVGERTGGAVVAGSPFLLSDKSLLYLAVSDVKVDGERLEGKGVEPDVQVADRLEFADGADPQLEKALDLAAGPLDSLR